MALSIKFNNLMIELEVQVASDHFKSAGVFVIPTGSK